VSNLNRRLTSVERRLAPSRSELPGILEIHLTQAWPACQEAPGSYSACSEHPPSCAVSSRAFRQPGRHVILRGVPWLGV
jgi:hypothetical protein